MAHLKINSETFVSFENGKPVSVCWTIKGMGMRTRVECQQDAERTLQACGFKVRISIPTPDYSYDPEWDHDETSYSAKVEEAL